MKAIKVHRLNAEKIRRLIHIRKDYKVKNDKDYVYFPVYDNIEVPPECSIINVDETFFDKIEERINLKRYLKNKGINIEKSSFEVIGDIAIIDIPKEYKKYEKDIAKGIMKVHKTVKTVLKKESGMQGILRIIKMRKILGEDKTETTYKENGCVYKVDVANMFYSTRLGNERLRIAKLVKENENVLVPFAGHGPFAVLIGKMHPKTKVVGIELNRDAVEYFKENIRLNRLKNVIVIEGDAKEKAKEYKDWADRIIMPLPKDATHFVKDMLIALKDKGFIHIYAFTPKNDPFTEIENEIRNIAKEVGYKTKVINKKIVRPYSSKIDEVVLDVLCRKE